MTQEELAGRTGLSVRAIGDLERGLTARPHRRSLELLAEALRLPEPVCAQLQRLSRAPAAPGGTDGAQVSHGGQSVLPSPPGGGTEAGPAPEWPGAQWLTVVPAGGAAPASRAAERLAPAQLPADIPDFTGRADQVERLRALLSGGKAEGSPRAMPVVLVVGPGGIGKTTVAVHAAHLLASEFPDGQLYASLLATTPPAEVLARFLRDLGIDGAAIAADAQERAAQYRTSLAGRRVLIVLDDAKDAAQVRPLLPGSGSCAVIITARAHMPDLVGARIIDLGTLPRGEARALFARVADEERALAEPEATEDVLAACAGLPLAIRIAGARLATRSNWSIRTLADRLADERRRLDELRVGNLAVRASFEVSYASLGPVAGGRDPAQAFRLLGLWTGPSLSLAAAAALLGLPGDAAADALDVLVDAHLLGCPSPDRYRFHDLLRVYAADRATTQEPEQVRAAAITRVLTWYLHTVEAAARMITPQRRQVPLGPDTPLVRPGEFATLDEALAWCEEERPGLLAATRLAAASGLDELAWMLPAAAMAFYFRRSHWADWIATHETGLAGARSAGDRGAEAWLLNNLGMAYGEQRKEESIGYLEQALSLRRELADGPGEAQAVTNLAHTYYQLGRYAEARTAARRAIETDRRLGDRLTEAHALGVLGSACRELGQPGEGAGYLQQALDIARELGTAPLEAVTLSDLAGTYLQLGRAGEAIAKLEESLSIQRDIGDRQGQAQALRQLGHAHRQAGALDLAHNAFAEALRLCEEFHASRGMAELQADLAALIEMTAKSG